MQGRGQASYNSPVVTGRPSCHCNTRCRVTATSTAALAMCTAAHVTTTQVTSRATRLAINYKFACPVTRTRQRVVRRVICVDTTRLVNMAEHARILDPIPTSAHALLGGPDRSARSQTPTHVTLCYATMEILVWYVEVHCCDVHIGICQYH